MCNPSDLGPHAQRAGGALALTVALCLTLCLTLALSLVGCAASGSAASALTPTRTSGEASGAANGTVGWSSYRDSADGFVVEYPRGATALDATATASASLASWRIANPQGGGDSATLEVTATTQASAGVCAHYTDGKPVTLAGGVIGYEQDNLSDPTPTSAASQPQIAVIALHSGLLTIITLTGQGQPNTFLQRWGSVWQHVLATFQPGQGPAGAQPCG